MGKKGNRLIRSQNGSSPLEHQFTGNVCSQDPVGEISLPKLQLALCSSNMFYEESAKTVTIVTGSPRGSRYSGQRELISIFLLNR